MSAQHAVGVVLALGKGGLDEFSDASVAAGHAGEFAPRLSFVDDASFTVDSAVVTLYLRDGKVATRRVESARGSLAVPLTDMELETKLRELCRWGKSGCNPEPLIDALWSLETRADAGSLMQLAAASE